VLEALPLSRGREYTEEELWDNMKVSVSKMEENL
jgi:hypothetical protein